MEREIGEIFEFEGKKLQVKAASKDSCEGCILDGKCTRGKKAITGFCERGYRDDEKRVIFVEVQEQPQKKQPKLNLCEILKHCPKGENFWSPMFGYVVYRGIIKGDVGVTVESGVPMIINADGTLTINFVTSPEIMLYPSKEQRDWTKVKYEPKKERFDPKTLKAFDRVIVYGENEGWFCSIFSHIGEGEYPYNTASGNYAWCVPYNNDTKHLVGTTDEAPEFYRYWDVDEELDKTERGESEYSHTNVK